MPSQLHETLLLLFRNRPTLAPKVLRDALQLELPSFSEARVESAVLTEIQPAEYRADLVVVLSNDASESISGRPALGIVVEVQLSPDADKRFVWPVYVVNLRARLRCPVWLLVVAANERVARWACKTVEIGARHHFTPLVLGPSGVPVITEEDQACADPELAVLSAMAHGNDTDLDTSVRIAIAARRAIARLDDDRSQLYNDLVMNSLNEAARRALQTMDLKNYQYQSEFARRYHSQGIAEGEKLGEQRGRAATVSQLLEMRFGPLSAEAQGAIVAAPVSELEAMAKRLLTAATLREALGDIRRRD